MKEHGEKKTELRLISFQYTIGTPEAFEANTGGDIVDIASNGSYTFVVRKNKEGVSNTSIYDETGRLVKPKVYVPRVISVKEVLEVAKTAGINDIYTSTPRGYESDYTKLLPKLFPGITSENVELIGSQLRGLFSGGSVNTDYSRDPEKLIRELVKPQAIRVKTDASDDYFIAREGDETAFVYKVREGGVSLPPESWKVQTVSKNDKDFKQKLAALPPTLDSEHLLFNDRALRLANNIIAYFAKEGNLTLVDDTTKQRLFSTGANDFFLDPTDEDTLYILSVQDNKTITMVKSSEVRSKNWKFKTAELKGLPGDAGEVRLDPNGNFILVISVEDEKGWLTVYEKDTGQKVAEITDVKGNLEVDRMGNVYYTDLTGAIRVVSTNSGAFKRGESIATTREEALQKLSSLAEKLTPEQLARMAVKGQEKDPVSAANKIVRDKLEELVGKKIDSASSIEELASIRAQLSALKEIQDFAVYSNLFFPFEERISAKEDTFNLENLAQSIDDLKSSSGKITTLDGAIAFQDRLTKLLTLRQQLTIRSTKDRKKIDATIETLVKTSEIVLDRFQEDLTSQIESLLETTKEGINSAMTLDELRLAQEAPDIDALYAYISKLTDTAKQREILSSLKTFISQRRESIKKGKDQADEALREKEAIAIQEIREATSNLLEGVLSLASTSKELSDLIRGNQQVIKLRARILSLSPDLREREEKNLDDLIRAKKAELDNQQSLGIEPKGKTRTVKFGKEEFPIFIPTRADSLRERNIPEAKEEWVLIPYHLEKLAEIARLLKLQQKVKRGILILEGESGTGKNVLLEIFAHFTNRELYNFSSNEGMDKNDILYSYLFYPKEGTVQVESTISQGITVPGAIVNIDEISALKAGPVKLLNPLLDHRRTLFSPEENKKKKAEPTVLFTATMNPQDYLGTFELPQDIKSRARIISVDYPPEKEGKIWRPDEAMIYAKHTDSLKDLKPPEFKKLWDYLINADKTSGGDKYSSDAAEADLKNIRELVKIANIVRGAYRAYKTGRNLDEINYVFSIREGIDIVSEMEYHKSVREAIKEVVLPEVSDPAEKSRIELLIGQA